MIKSAFTYCQVLVYLLLPTFLNSAFALDIPQNDTPTYTHELEPFPSDAYQIAKATFLPEVQDSDLGWGNNTIKDDYNSTNCDDYTRTSCPSVGRCERCPFNAKLYKVLACVAPYLLSDGNCVCPPAKPLSCTNDKCTKYCGSTCIEKTCTPSPNQTNCTNGTLKCDNGCCSNTRDCCKPCTHKITSKPENSSYTTEKCIDGDGSHDINSGWKCNTGYHEKNGECERDCIANNCSGYTLTTCPSDKICDECTIRATNCSTDGKKYKITGCKDNKQDTDTYWCSVPKTIDCATLGYTRSPGSCGNLVQLACPFDTSKVACIDFE